MVWVLFLGFCIGFFVGGTLGALAMAICAAGGQDDQRAGRP